MVLVRIGSVGRQLRRRKSNFLVLTIEKQLRSIKKEDDGV
jgi:hypothetical protein